MKKSLKDTYSEGLLGLTLIPIEKLSKPIPLNTICPCWRSALFPTEFEALQRGIAREKERFQNKPFILYSLQRNSDYDSFWGDYLELIEGFTDEASAIRQARTHASRAVSRVLTQPQFGVSPWRQVEHPSVPVFPVENKESDVVKRVFHERLKVADNLGYNSIYFRFEVLHVRTLDIIGPELFCFIDDEWAWISFLTDRGKTEKEKP